MLSSHQFLWPYDPDQMTATVSHLSPMLDIELDRGKGGGRHRFKPAGKVIDQAFDAWIMSDDHR